jgi:hypothetical protein
MSNYWLDNKEAKDQLLVNKNWTFQTSIGNYFYLADMPDLDPSYITIKVTVPLKPPPNLKIDILPEAENLHCE